MANIKQQVKRNLQNEKKRLRNASFKSSLRTAMKNVTVLCAKNDPKANEALSFAFKKLDKAQAKGLVHKNYVARHKSTLATLVNTTFAQK
ncbi:MAG: 30S ribosomal protein S20 [Erysipelotrichales bacterium]|nr:30S ribosomal protein S20 [Erysipelotrichales bacterium]